MAARKIKKPKAPKKKTSFRALVRGMKDKHRASKPKRKAKMAKHDDDDDKKLGHAKPKPVGSKTPGGGEVLPEPEVSLDQPGEISPPPNPPEEKTEEK